MSESCLGHHIGNDSSYERNSGGKAKYSDQREDSVWSPAEDEDEDEDQDLQINQTDNTLLTTLTIFNTLICLRRAKALISVLWMLLVVFLSLRVAAREEMTMTVRGRKKPKVKRKRL